MIRMQTVRFEIAYGITRQNEGGYHNASGSNSADRGGETFKGIARRIWPNWSGWAIVDFYKSRRDFPNNALSDLNLGALVRDFYRREFWDKNRLSDFKSQPIVNEMFDTGVNVGVRQSALWLQRSINLLNRNQRNWSDIDDDGIIGSITLGLVNGMGESDTKTLFNLLNVYQGRHYLDLAEKDPTQEEFIRGWLTRIELMK